MKLRIARKVLSRHRFGSRYPRRTLDAAERRLGRGFRLPRDLVRMIERAGRDATEAVRQWGEAVGRLARSMSIFQTAMALPASGVAERLAEALPDDPEAPC